MKVMYVVNNDGAAAVQTILRGLRLGDFSPPSGGSK